MSKPVEHIKELNEAIERLKKDKHLDNRPLLSLAVSRIEKEVYNAQVICEGSDFSDIE